MRQTYQLQQNLLKEKEYFVRDCLEDIVLNQSKLSKPHIITKIKYALLILEEAAHF